VSSDKTEKATPRKIEDARKKGMVAKSTELNMSISMFSMFLTLLIYGPIATEYLTRMVREYLTNQTILTMEGYDYDLVELTSSTLRIKEVVADFDADGNPVTYTYSYTFTKQ
jgi:flagellar biosynthetic protein FlhB